MQAQYKSESQKRLQEWMTERKLNITECSLLIGISRSNLSRLLSGISKPMLETAFHIEKITHGYVKAKLWLKISR